MVYYYGMYRPTNYLAHHGILGMKWGKRNGPPYPLDASDHSQSEKKAGWRKSLDRSSKQSNNVKVRVKRTPSKTTNKRKDDKTEISHKARNIALTVAALAVIGGTSYYLAKSGKLDNLIASGKSAVNEFRFPEESVNKHKVWLVNKKLRGTPEGSINCVHCSVSDFLNSHFGMNTTAKGNYGVDEVSGMVMPAGRDGRVLNGIFDGMIHRNIIEEQHLKYFPITSISRNQIWSKTFNSIPPNSEGIMYLTSKDGGHAVRYIKNAKGIVAFLDPQTGGSHSVFTAKMLYGNAGFIPTEIYDMTNASLLPNARDVLQYFVDGF